MFSNLCQLGSFQGDKLLISAIWASLIFFGSADCEVSRLLRLNNHIDKCSGNDPPCVGSVRSIKAHLSYPLHTVGLRSHRISNLVY